MWDDAAKGENVLFRIPRNLIWNDNVVVREDEYAVFSGMVKYSQFLTGRGGSGSQHLTFQFSQNSRG